MPRRTHQSAALQHQNRRPARVGSRPKSNAIIVAARANGMNVAKAQHQKWLGSMALSKGDRPGAIRHFRLAENDLSAEGFRVSRNGQYNKSRTNLNANETSQDPIAVNMNSNRGANSAY